MDGLTLLIFHIIVIVAVMVTIATISYNAGKRSGYDSMSREKQVKKEKIV